MKLTLFRPAMLLALALSVAGCGSKNMFDVNVLFVDEQGSPALPLYPGLVLTNGSDTLAVEPKSTSAKFPKQIEYGTVYSVTTPPKGQQPAHQNCVVFSGGSDTAGRLASINVYVKCTVDQHAVQIAVTGLNGAETLVLANGRSGLNVIGDKDNTKPTTVLPVKFDVFYNDAYGITVVTPPAGSKCAVENGVGVMGDVDVTNVKVLCTKI